MMGFNYYKGAFEAGNAKRGQFRPSATILHMFEEIYRK